jgi:hypothetical protein
MESRRPMKSVSARALLAAALLAFAGTAAAAPLEKELPPGKDTCWDRWYDEAHLAKHPQQQVTAFRVVRQGSAATDGIFVMLMFNLRKRTHVEAPEERNFDYTTTAFCKASRSGLNCENEYGLGRFRVDPDRKGGLIVRNLGLMANPSNYDAEDISDNAVKIPAKPDDGAWAVSTINPVKCPY